MLYSSLDQSETKPFPRICSILVLHEETWAKLLLSVKVWFEWKNHPPFNPPTTAKRIKIILFYVRVFAYFTFTSCQFIFCHSHNWPIFFVLEMREKKIRIVPTKLFLHFTQFFILLTRYHSLSIFLICFLFFDHFHKTSEKWKKHRKVTKPQLGGKVLPSTPARGFMQITFGTRYGCVSFDLSHRKKVRGRMKTLTS